ncbi:MAG: hypothetical protein M3501_04040, partial [Actinomycetota bacterium]|nr:hypothetical protein [Actinomycetota bacterium]
QRSRRLLPADAHRAAALGARRVRRVGIFERVTLGAGSGDEAGQRDAHAQAGGVGDETSAIQPLCSQLVDEVIFDLAPLSTDGGETFFR